MLMHMLERKHNENFIAMMDQFMQQWRLLRAELNQAPLAHVDWEY
jgi:predicted metal-dependent hydrolase